MTAQSLTPVEELEQLEQQITLTLQEIDRNFHKAHTILTSNILPIVERYGDHSKNISKASEPLTQFLETAAGVSLSFKDVSTPADDVLCKERSIGKELATTLKPSMEHEGVHIETHTSDVEGLDDTKPHEKDYMRSVSDIDLRNDSNEGSEASASFGKEGV